jgi:hypothetical protein
MHTDNANGPAHSEDREREIDASIAGVAQEQRFDSARSPSSAPSTS